METTFETFWKWRGMATVLYWISLCAATIFVGAYVFWKMMVSALASREYPSGLSLGGFYVHAISGSVYLLCGFVQFNSTIRRDFPSIHRLTGYLYYVLTIFIAIGVCVICIGGAIAGESSVVASLTIFPLWLYYNYKAYRFIKMGDVKHHRDYNFRCFVVSFSIIFIRPLLILLSIFTNKSPNEELKVALWWGVIWGYIGAELYLYLENRLRPIPFLYALGMQPLNWAEDVNVPEFHEVDIAYSIRLNNRTIKLCFELKNKASVVPVFFGGQHVTLLYESYENSTCSRIQRSYTPITDERLWSSGRVEIIARLVEGGKMSQVFAELMDSSKNSILQDTDMADRTSTERLMYKSFLLQSPFKIAFPSGFYHYWPNVFNRYLMVAAGSGITSFVNIIRTILNNPQDTSMIELIFINKCEEDVFLLEQLSVFASTGRFRHTLYLSTNRFTVNDIQLRISQGSNNKQSPKSNLQILLSGPPQMVRQLDYECRSILGVNRRQLVSFGYSDR